MRTLAPMFVTTCIIALASGSALAMGDHNKRKAAPRTDTTTEDATKAPGDNRDAAVSSTSKRSAGGADGGSAAGSAGSGSAAGSGAGSGSAAGSASAGSAGSSSSSSAGPGGSPSGGEGASK